MSENENITGYPSVDKPWLKYYSEEAINDPLPNCTIYDYIWKRNKNNLNSEAIRYFGKRISFGDLFDNIKKVATALTSYGVKKGDTVAVCLPSIPEAVYLIYALNYIGAIPNMLDPRYNEKLLGYCLDEAPTKLLFTLDLCYKKFLDSKAEHMPDNIILIPAVNSASLPIKLLASIKGKNVKPTRNLDKTWNDFFKSALNSPIEEAERDLDGCAFILHTGGTTGNPKGVMLSNNAINSIAHQYSKTGYGIHERGQSVIVIIPPFASYGLCASINMPLACGVTLYLVPKFDPDKFGDLIAKYKPTYIAGVPSFFENMIQNKKIQESNLSYMVSLGCGGDSMSIEQEERINRFLEEHHSHARIDKGYGMSEVSATACVCTGNIRKPGSIGAPFVNTTIKIVDTVTGKECKYDETGEICISGPGMMIGYIGNEELTKKTIRTHEDGMKWVHTGDLGHITRDGFLFHDGRIKRMMVRFDGFKIYPEAVEQSILKHPQVAQCAVVKARDPKLGAIAKAYIVLNKNVSDNGDIWNEIVEYCKEELAERSIPQDHVFVDDLPLTSMGKIDYRKLEED